MATSMADVMETCQRGMIDYTFLGGAQIDAYGNLNSTMIGADYANTPPAHALARRGIVANVAGYTVYGDYTQPDPPARIVTAVETGEIDLAVVWGPLAGYFATRSPVPLDLVAVSPAVDPPALPSAISPIITSLSLVISVVEEGP